ncbi:MAG TPA: PASTA domain-containing protein [Chitinophagales bacterium]|nr:PASTA domain-containing protein [Chitinophagales bacterium]
MERTKSLWQFIRSRKFLYNVLGALAFYAFFVVIFILFVRWYTNHGESIKVPEVRGQNFNDAVKILESQHLRFQISDSSFDDSKPSLTVLDQNPRPKSQVKEYRTVYLTVNSKAAPQIQLPDLKDVSLKQASMILQSYGLKVGTLTYKPDLAKDVVLAMNLNGREVLAGTNVKKGSKIDLVLGDGLGQTQIEVPNLIGLSLREAKFVLDGSSLNLGALVLDASVKNDTLDAVVYKQIPDANDVNNKMNAGEGVDVFLTSPDDYNSK